MRTGAHQMWGFRASGRHVGRQSPTFVLVLASSSWRVCTFVAGVGPNRQGWEILLSQAASCASPVGRSAAGRSPRPPD